MSFFELMQESLPILLQGLVLTLELAGLSLAIAMVIGVFAALMGLSKHRILRLINQAFVAIIRCSPLLVQTFFIYFGVTGALGIRMSAFTAGVIALSLNAGGYLSEIFRGGIQAVDPGQNEAARSLGLSQWQAMIKVVFPQGIKNAIPALSNELVVNIKDSSVLSVIGVFDLMFATKTVVGIYFKQVEMYAVAAVVYLCLTMVASWFLGKFARHLSVEPQPLTSVSDMNSTVGTVAGTGSSEYSLDMKKARG